MRTFHCDHCHLALFFENTLCSRCHHTLAYLPDLGVMASLDSAGQDTFTTPIPRSGGRQYRLCRNYTAHNACNWAIPADAPFDPDDDATTLCLACRLNRVIPDLTLPDNLTRWRKIEAAKRRAIYSLLALQLPLDAPTPDGHHLAFQFLSDTPGNRVLTGHSHGLITLNIAEADDVERERTRVSMHEPYRTLLGHFRHELGHWYWELLVEPSRLLEPFRSIFGDERTDYAGALKHRYENGPPASDAWQKDFVSAYASIHPWEDWAETWAHYMHMTDALETAATNGLSLSPARPDEPRLDPPPPKPLREQAFEDIINAWYPLTYALNNLSRSIGQPDAYPFVLSTRAVEKLRFVHDTICQAHTLLEPHAPAVSSSADPAAVSAPPSASPAVARAG